MKAALSRVLTDAVELDGLLKTHPGLAITSHKKRNRVGTSRPDVNPMTTKQGDSFLAHALVHAVKDQGCTLSMDGRGGWRDHVFVERLWKSVKYERVYLYGYDSVAEARTSITQYLG